MATLTETATTDPAVSVQLTTRPVNEDEVELVDDLDTIAGNEVMRGCGDDNPY
ncbi:hypothetical protein [Streptomyces sp. AJS327]|uniref:hypothetical protein n=1 Tax=Streptomyces sp. AJS327 TaxID=2545265 RepID=UPI0015DD7E5D|nr:hypothetical protein [Streptomyces sp. AJS327]